MKTILVHCDGGKTISHRLAVAADVARRFDAVLAAVYAKAAFDPPMTGKPLDMDALYRAHEHRVASDQNAARTAFHEALAGGALTAEWHSYEGRADKVLERCSRYADLVVVGQATPERMPALPSDLPETVAMSGGRPVLVVPHLGAPQAVGETVMLCWNSSRESARAAADALPFLKRAKKIIVLIVEPRSSNRDSGANLAAWLARHGVKVTVQREVAPEATVAQILLSRAADHDADLIVMGVYGHSRLRETMLGGASRTMLASMNVPVLMSH